MNNNQTKPGAMVREERYIVIKRKDLEAASGDSHTGISEAEVALRDHLDSWQVGTRSALVIESDWPEYEPAWRMIEARINGAEQPPCWLAGSLNAYFVNWNMQEYYQNSEGDICFWEDVAPLLAEIERLKALSVSNILLTVVPGEDGMGEEVYARSVADVQKLFSTFVDRQEELEARIAELEAGQGEPLSYMVISTSGHPEKCTAKDPEGFPVYRQAQPATAKVDELEEFNTAVISLFGFPHTQLCLLNGNDLWKVWQARAKLNGGA